MAKDKRQYVCRDCGGISSKWVGQCPDCGEWNTLEETVQIARSPAAKTPRRDGYAGDNQITSLGDVSPESLARSTCGIDELDRVLGGGIVNGSVTLLGGDPGIGKSTLLLQSMAVLAQQGETLYVSGEESMQQITLRAQRLNIRADNLKLLTETCVETIIDLILRDKPKVVVIDSIQTMYTETLQSAPGAVAQLREATARLVRFAKQSGIAMFIVGHVTKEGALAGPRVLEHMVDTVLYFEGDPGSRYRVIRAVKNRFGAVNELGVFAMGDKGLQGVSNPSAIFLSRHEEAVAGSVIMVTREGTRPLLVETQALVDTASTHHARRVTLGLEQNRLSMLLAVLHRHAGIAMLDHDVFVNVVGGVRVNETAADMAVLIAALSSFRDRPVSNQLVTFGEVGLAGEVRPVPNGEERLREAAKHGFTDAIVPKANAPRSAIPGMRVQSVTRLSEVLDLI
ncbi:MAG: DNA repair protein RadA [Pseudomonadota bacterium]